MSYKQNLMKLLATMMVMTNILASCTEAVGDRPPVENCLDEERLSNYKKRIEDAIQELDRCMAKNFVGVDNKERSTKAIKEAEKLQAKIESEVKDKENAGELMTLMKDLTIARNKLMNKVNGEDVTDFDDPKNLITELPTRIRRAKPSMPSMSLAAWQYGISIRRINANYRIEKKRSKT